MRQLWITVCSLIFCASALAQSETTFVIDSNGSDIVTTARIGDVTTFQITIVFTDPIATGVYDNPPLESVVYSVSGDPVSGSPSGFPSFALERTITGADFYAQGSSLNFEVASGAILTDGVTANELVEDANGVVFTFNGREVGNGRFHPALLELRADGTATIQNSDNVITESPLEQVAFGAEYITDFTYVPAEFIILSDTPVLPPAPPNPTPAPFGGSGSGAIGLTGLGGLLLLGLFGSHRRRLSIR